MRRNNNRTIIFLVLLVLLVIGVGYAYLTSNLSITGATSVAGNTWDIHFENVVESSDNTITPTIAPVANPQDKVTDLTYSIRFDKPGDVYEFNVDVVNAGTIDAMIESFTSKIKIGDGELQEVSKDTLPNYLKYYIRYADGVNIKENQLLHAADRETITVHVEFKEDITEADLEEAADETILLDIDIKYIQATEEGEEKPIRLNCTYEGDLVNNAEYVNGQYTYRYNSSTDGWSASITDRNSTDPVTTPLCSTINGKPIRDMSGMFAISKATSIDLSSFDTSHVTNMSSMFYDAEVEELDVSSFNTENVTNMSSMFSGTSIASIDISNFDMHNVISMSYMFDSTSIERLDMSNLNIKNVQSMEYLCTKCTNLKYINLNNGGSDKLTGFFDVLYNADNVEEIHMKNFNFGTVSNLGTTSGMFYNKQKLKVVDLSGAKMSNIDSTYNAFYNCKELEELNLSNIYAPKTQLYAYRMFYDNLKLNSLDISSFDFSQLNTNTNAGMFTNVPATTVYVKDQANVDTLNALSDKPSTITFVVKP